MATAAYATQADQRTALRARLGQGTSSEVLSDAEIDECLSAALWETNRRDPLWFFSSFTASANTQRYLATSFAPTNKVGPMEVYWGRSGAGSGCATPGIFSSLGDAYQWMIGQILGGQPGQVLVDTAALEIWAYRYTALQRYLGGRGWEGEDGYVWLDPIPTTATAVYYMCPIERYATALSMTREHIEALMDYAVYRGALLMAAKQSEIASVNMAGGKLIGTAGGMVYMRIAEDALARFEARLQLPAVVSPL